MSTQLSFWRLIARRIPILRRRRGDSPSQWTLLIQHGVAGVSKSLGLGSGSIARVVPFRFMPQPTLRLIGCNGLGRQSESETFILFIGQLHPDAEIDHLLLAFSGGRLLGDSYLLMVRPDEGKCM
jgi:hypothetical protein